jgi:hypothetical protein
MLPPSLYSTRALICATVGSIAVLVWIAPALLRSTFDQWRSGAWPVAPGSVIASTVSTVGGSRSSNLRIDLEYRYVVGGREYIGTKYSLMSIAADWFEPPKQLAARFPTGSRVSIHYDPADPSVATIRTGLASYDVGLLMLYGALVSVTMFFTFRELASRFQDPASRSVAP